MAIIVLVVGAIGLGGCSSVLYRFGRPPPPKRLPNPVSLPGLPAEFVWQQTVDVVDDYFSIHREQMVQNRGPLQMEGRIQTVPKVGSSMLEFWRRDSTPGFERLQSSLQSIRRRAVVTVRPQGGAYDVEVVVFKELEVVDRSQASTEAAAAVRHDGTVVRSESLLNSQPITLGWEPLGRDISLEQQILADIIGRVTQADAPKTLLDH
jgi:hypothetical protein